MLVYRPYIASGPDMARHVNFLKNWQLLLCFGSQNWLREKAADRWKFYSFAYFFSIF
jgi:hypothetical protein